MSRELREEMKTVSKYLSVLFCSKIHFQGKPIRMERALCPLRTEHNSVVTSVAIHCSFLSASFKVHILCHKKKVLCFGSHNETGFNSNRQ